MESYSQFGQDLVVRKLVNNFKHGFFVDVGCGNFKNLSNTYALEQEIAWSGICIDGNEKHIASFKDKRKSLAIREVISSSSGEEVKFLSCHVIGGIVGRFKANVDITDDRLEKITTNRKNAIENGHTSTEVTKTLEQVLDEHNAPPIIDYLSIDVEGLEVDILQTLPESKRSYAIISAEINGEVSDYMNVMLPLGYKYIRCVRDFIFYREDLLTKYK